MTSRVSMALRSSSSGGQPPAAHECPFLSMAFYNVGIQNSEVTGRNWSEKYERLKRDIQKIFDPTRGVQALFILEFGNMFKNIDKNMRNADSQPSKRRRGGVPQPAARTETSTLELFRSIVLEIHRPDITVRAHPPYVALVSTEDWSVVRAVPLDRLCTDETLFVQLTHLKHVSGAQNVFVFNCHAPTSVVTEQRKKDVVTRLMEIGTEAQRSGGPHPAAGRLVSS